MTVHQHRIITTAATALVLGAALATPAAARQDPGPALAQKPASTSSRGEATQFISGDAARTLGNTAQWAWAQRLERELCVRYGDTSCSQ